MTRAISASCRPSQLPRSKPPAMASTTATGALGLPGLAAKSAAKAESSATLFKSAKAFEAWLKKHHATSDGLWLKIAKRGADEPSVTYPEAVEIALCWGWIDGQKKGLDEQHWLQRFTPRRARSVWSKINIDKAAALIEAGRMQAPGYAQIEAAK